MNYLSKENVQEVLGLAPLQESIWQAHSGAGEIEAIEQVRFTLTGIVDASQFQRAWDHMVQTNPILRSIFRQTRTRNVQVVLKTRPAPVTFHDLSARSAFEQQNDLTTISLEQNKPFELANGPLVRVALCQIAPQECLVFVTYHHIVLDEESCQMMLEDLLAIYNAGLHGRPSPSLKRPLYQQYLGWLAQQDWAPARTFWTKQLRDLDGPTKLNIARNVVSEKSDGYLSHAVSLSEPLSQELSALAMRHNVTRNTVLQAAWAVLLSRYSTQEEVVYSVRCSGRPKHLPGASEIIGRFAQTVPERIFVDGDLALADFLQVVQKQHEDLTAYAYLPLNHEHIGSTEHIEPANSLIVREPATIQGEAQELRLVAHEALLDRSDNLSVAVTLRERWHIAMSCSAHIVSSEELEKLLLHFQILLENMVRQEEKRVADLDMLSLDEQAFLLHTDEQGDIAYPLDRFTHQVIEEQALLHPQKIAVIYKDERITYEALNKKANQLAHWLKEQGFARNDLAALLAERGIDMLIAILAIFKAGGAYVPLDAAHPDSRLRMLLQACGTKVLLTQHHLLQRSLLLTDDLPAPCTVFCLDATTPDDRSAHAGLLQHYAEGNSECINEPGDLAYVMYTSGSTGIPKGVMIEHIGMLNHLGAKIQLLQLSPTSIVVQSASHCFDISVWQFLAPLMVGGTVAIYDNGIVADPEALLAALQRDRVTVVEVVPTLLDMLLQVADDLSLEARALPDLDYVLSTGEGLPVPLCRKWFAAYPHINVINAYGPTECSDDVTHEVFLRAPAEEQNALSIGRPIQRFNVYVLDNRQRLLPVGCIGEICVTGIGVGRGYLHDPERTQAAFLSNPFCDDPNSIYARLYRTGDLGYLLPDGRIIHLGRLDSQVKVRGHRIELGEVEATLLRHPAVKQCVATAQLDSQNQVHILAYVVLEDGVEATLLREFMREQLPGYMLPEHILTLDAFPMTSNQKIDRKALPLPHAFEAHATEAQFASPRNETEAHLVEIWSEVLGVSPIGVDDSFFQLGGHSLKLIQIRSRIKQRFAVALDLRVLFEHQTIRQLAPLIDHSVRVDNNHRTGSSSIDRIFLSEPVIEYPMSHTQKRFWFQQQLMPQSYAYAMPVALQLEGPLDTLAFQQAWQRIVDRHASLRTTFTIKDGEPAQRISQTARLACLCLDLSSLHNEAQQQIIARIIESETQMGFDLETGPLFRVRWAILAPQQYLLLLNMHHIISDAWSWQIVQQEFTDLYAAFSHQRPDPLPELPIQYVDYTHWQNTQVAEGLFEAHEHYWIARFTDVPPPLDLPTDYERPALPSYQGQGWHFALNAALAARLKQFCQEHETTLFIVLLSVISILFFRLSEQEDIVIGTPVSGRDRIELEGLIGCFINMLPLRVNLVGRPTFLEFLERVKSTAIEAYTHQDYPFDVLVDKLNLARDPGRSPLFSVMFQVQQNMSNPPHGDLTVKPYTISIDRALYDLAMTFEEREDGIDGWLEYRTDLFEQESIIRMSSYVQTLLEAIVADPEQSITSIPLLSETHYRLLLNHGTTHQPYPSETLVHQLFEVQVQRTPQALAVICGEYQLSYQELNSRANQLAHHLQRLGIGPESMVAIFLERSVEMVIALLAVLKAGGTYVPLDPIYSGERLAFMLDDSGVTLLITQQSLLDHLPPHQVQMICLDIEQKTFSHLGTANLEVPLKAGHLCYAIYTSGSTGRPKGVQVSHQALVNFLLSVQREPGMTAQDTLLAVATLSFDPAEMELYLPLITGARLVIASREVAANGFLLAKLLEQADITFMQGTPITWRMLLASGWAGKPDLKVLCGGEAFPIAMARDLLPRVGSLYNLYGPTETTICSTLHKIESADHPIPIGRPIANTSVVILDDHFQPVPIGVAGELYIGGAGVAQGYIHRPEHTAERFLPNPFSEERGARLYKTGDRVRYRADGRLEFLGRTDQQVKLRGYRIELAEIESACLRHPALREAVVVMQQLAGGESRLVAYLTTVPGYRPEPHELRNFLKQQLPDFMVPAAFVFLPALPLTPNGKVDRKQLPAPETEQAISGASYIVPRDLFELEMTKLWEEMLHTHPVSIYDEFFALGGSSLSVIQLMGAIQVRFGVRLSLADFLREPTIAQLCSTLRKETALSARCLVPLQQGNTSRPLFIVHPQGGGVLCYLYLAKALGNDETVYGLQAPGYDSDEPFLNTIEEMACQYIAEMRHVAASGPYRLAGWSMGGAIAFEMARQLEALGECVSFLGLIDTHAPEGEGQAHTSEQPSIYDIQLDLAANYFDLDPSALTGLDEEEIFALLLNRARTLDVLPPEDGIEFMRRQVDMMRVNYVAMEAYRVQTHSRIQANISLFQASENEERSPVEPQQWQRYTRGTVTAFPAPGDHHTMMNPPFVLDLADAMRVALYPLIEQPV